MYPTLVRTIAGRLPNRASGVQNQPSENVAVSVCGGFASSGSKVIGCIRLPSVAVTATSTAKIAYSASAMAEEERTRRWQRISRPAIELDPLQALRAAIVDVRNAPRDPEARRRLRALAAEQGMWEQLALLLADEARAAADRPELGAAFYEELADVYENLDQPLEMIVAMEEVIERDPDDVEHHDRIAWLYRREGAWAKAAQAFERVAALARDDRARAALRAAGKIYRDNQRLDQAASAYRTIVKRWPSDTDAWRALDELLTELGRWRELAELRGVLASRTPSGIEKAVHLRAQARALEKAGDSHAAADLVANAARHAPEDVSGLVDYAAVLAREGRGRDAADILEKRIAEATSDGAPPADLAGLQMRLVGVLDDSCQDRVAAGAVLDRLLATMPEFLPALEKLVQHTAQDPDPRAHAAALLRYAAALPEDADRSKPVIDAARRFAEARDYRAAVQTFERAIDLAPEDDQLRDDLENARTALVVERAASEVSSGDAVGAERRLRSILGSHPHHIDANLAFVDLLAATGRLDAAVEHLRDTLSDAPEDLPPDQIARLVHRYALAMAALGEADEAHQLLHEAHHLDRKSLTITLALGESCFARRLWREAALHLGSLAEHPHASRHAAAVATGLVHAALADIRALRPASAPKRYQRAVEIDPKCTRAWHALAEAAIESGDMIRGAECLEAEASSTTDPSDRLRLYDALGDLAIDVLADEARAERYWSEVADAGSAAVLGKLLAVQRRRGAGVSRGDTCERLAALSKDPRTLKELTEEAADTFAAGGDHARARDAAKRLMIAYPLDVDAVSCASAIALAACDFEKAAAWLGRALSAWDADRRPQARDPRRADLWRRLGDAERARGDKRAALTAYQRAVSADPESDGALGARRGLVDLAASSGRSAITSLVALVEADQDPADVVAWARQLAAANNVEDARAAFELARTLGAPISASDENFLTSNAPREMASDEAYAAPLDDAERRALVDDDADAPLGELFDLLGEAVSLVCPDVKNALFNADLGDASRLSPSSDSATAAIYPQIANALGGPQTLLYARAGGGEPEVMVLFAAPPVVVVNRRLAQVRARSRSDASLESDAELRFRLGRVVELARPRRIFAAGTDRETFAHLVTGVRHAFGTAVDRISPAAAAQADRLRSVLPLQLRRRITEWLASHPQPFDTDGYLAACERAADRAGLLACGDISAAIDLSGGPERARHLVRLAAAPRYLAARRKLRSRK
ncbi:MAG: Tetratricopeptide 2 repeat protein [Myxococcales bacterium]|nr:Tetratricopeptide 2 repeat protein [Myxococcales bacterium]